MVCDKVVCHKEAQDAEAEEAGGTDLKRRTPHNVGNEATSYWATPVTMETPLDEGTIGIGHPQKT